MRKKIVVLTGAGISAESGIKTFRDADGLWEGHDVMQVASPEGWRKDRSLVLDFFNQRRAQLHEVHPNDGHRALVELEKDYDLGTRRNVQISHRTDFGEFEPDFQNIWRIFCSIISYDLYKG